MHSRPKTMATMIIIEKLKKPGKHVFNGDNKGKSGLDVKGQSDGKKEKDK